MKRYIYVIAALAVILTASVSAEGYIVGEHLRDRILESPHPYPPAVQGKATLVHSDYYDFPDASYLVFEFSKFDLGPGDWVEVRHPFGEQIHVYTDQGLHNKGGDFITKAVLGSEAIIDLYSTNPENSHYGYRIERITRGFSPAEMSRMYGPSRAICGTDDKLDAICFETSHPEVYEKSKAAVRILMDGSALCTGWLVSCEDHLITNCHCSWEGDFDSQSKLDRMEFQFMYQRPQCGSGTATVEYSFQSGVFIEYDHYIDYTLIQAPPGENPSDTYGWINMDDRLADIDEQMFIVNHPGGVPKQISLISTHSQDQSGLCEVYTLNADPCISGASAPELGYYCDTEGGSSGSPVLSLVTMKAIGLHHCANCPNRALHIQDVWTHNQAGPNPLPPCTLFNEIGAVDLDREYYGCDDTVDIMVNDGSLPGAGTQDVTIWSDTESTPETIILIETPADSGTFLGSIATTTGSPSPGDGFLSITPGDTITVEYIDADDGQGGVNIPRYDYAEADCTDPVISNVAIDWVGADEAQISWTTNEPCNSTVVYGTTTPPGTTVTDDELTTSHTVLLEGLIDCTPYRFAVRSADEAGNLTEDSNGGAYYTFTTLELLSYFADDVENGENGWTYNGLWHIVPEASTCNEAHSPTHSWYYGQESTCTFNTGSANSGTLTSPIIDLTAVAQAELQMWYWFEGESSSTYDTMDISIQIVGGAATVLETVTETTSGWVELVADLTPVCGNQVQITCFFDTYDSVLNDYQGAYIDDVMVFASQPCEEPCINDGDVNNDESITAGDAQLAFQIALGLYSPTPEEACAADCNGDESITAGDAQQIFMTALGTATCVDPL
ncbi:MAG TPA: trypsin-like peptidase domain-containing protein [bacterium]|nr:trypsin-like peptidase domain-containing protein [bacterium]